MSGPVGTMPLHKKLRLQAGFRCLTVDAPKVFFSLLDEKPPNINFETTYKGEYDWVMLFTTRSTQLIETAPKVLPLLLPDGLLWITYPKGTSKLKDDLNRDTLWNVMHSHGYKAVTQVFVDSDWTAMRFRSLKLIGK